MLEHLGLDETAVRIYLEASRSAGVDAATLTTTLAIEPARVNAGLEQLRDLGLIRSSHSNPGLWRTEAPHTALSALISQRRSQVAAAHDALSGTRAAAEQLSERYRTAVHQPTVHEYEHLRGVDQIVARVVDYAQHATTTIDSIVQTPPPRHMLEDAKVDEQRILDRGVLLRVLYPAVARYNPDIIDYAQWLHERGGQVRPVPEIPTRMVLYDRAAAMIMFDPDEKEHGAVLLTTPGAVTGLAALFQMLWDTGVPMVDEEDEQLTGDERSMLELLARGMKDEAIARTLKSSPRTVRRTLAVLSHRAGVASRFTLGVYAAEQGWVSLTSTRASLNA